MGDTETNLESLEAGSSQTRQQTSRPSSRPRRRSSSSPLRGARSSLLDAGVFDAENLARMQEIIDAVSGLTGGVAGVEKMYAGIQSSLATFAGATSGLGVDAGNLTRMSGIISAAVDQAGLASVEKMYGGIQSSLATYAGATSGLGVDAGNLTRMSGIISAAVDQAALAGAEKMYGDIQSSLVAVTAGLSREMTPFGVALSSQHLLDGLSVSVPEQHSLRPLYDALVERGSLQVRLASQLQFAQTDDRDGLSATPMRRWRELLETVDNQNPLLLQASESTMDTNNGILGGELLLSVHDSNETAVVISDELVQPWEAARDEARKCLYRKLELLDPAIPIIIDGAWHDISLNGPAATMKIANAVVEMLDRSIRAAAPECAVLSWHRDEGRSAGELHEGRPTRGLRFHYIASLAGLPGSLVKAQAASLTALMQEAQKAKHSAAVDHVAAQVLLVTAESLLTSLFSRTQSPVERGRNLH